MLVTTALCACGDQEIPEIEISNSVELGKSEVYLNGEQYENYTEFFHDTINDQLLFGFRQGEESLLNSLSFSFLPVSEGEYIVHNTFELYLGAQSYFGQTVNSEFDGWVYKLINAENGFFEISKLDQENMIIEGNFKVEFEIGSKNGYEDTGLPEKVKFQGVFHENYIKV
jgi:hypothetical protein